MRIVIDTNVLASAVFFGGRPAELLRMVVMHELSAVATDEIVFATFYGMVGLRIYGANGSTFLLLLFLWGIIIAGGCVLFRLTKEPA